jgi:hypothetical protein
MHDLWVEAVTLAEFRHIISVVSSDALLCGQCISRINVKQQQALQHGQSEAEICCGVAESDWSQLVGISGQYQKTRTTATRRSWKHR